MSDIFAKAVELHEELPSRRLAMVLQGLCLQEDPIKNEADLIKTLRETVSGRLDDEDDLHPHTVLTFASSLAIKGEVDDVLHCFNWFMVDSSYAFLFFIIICSAFFEFRIFNLVQN